MFSHVPMDAMTANRREGIFSREDIFGKYTYRTLNREHKSKLLNVSPPLN